MLVHRRDATVPARGERVSRTAKKVASDVFVDSLNRLTADGSPLQSTLHELRELTQDPNHQPSEELAANVAQVVRDLSALQVGSKRVVNQVEQLQGLVRTSAIVTSSLDIDRVLEEVMDTAINLTNAERAFLMLRADGSGELELRAARNWDRESLGEEELTISRGVMATVLESGEPVLTLNAQGDSRFQGHASVMINDLRSIICIPLKLRDQVSGVLYADNRLEQGVFDQDSVDLVASFANFAAIAIDNARHFMRVTADLADAKREVSRLKIEINEQRLNSELSEITETDYFQRLSSLARDLRKRKGEPD
jgi:transcriptional regulator with GAF, ATPase, and Fis domain